MISKFIFLSILLGVVLCWSNEDIEIFKLQSLLKQFSPVSDSFYDLLSIDSKASIKEVSKKFKKLSLKYHPDKAGNGKEANDYYEFLQLASSILRDGQKKKIYDYYLNKGFPKYIDNKWGFYKFKPGTVFAFSVVLIIIGVFHYISLLISYNSNLKRTEKLVNEIKSMDSNPMDFKEKRVIHPVLNKEFLIRVDGVFLVEKVGNWDDFTENFIRIDSSNLEKPDWRDSLFIRIPVYLWNSSIGRLAFKINLIKPKLEKKIDSEPVKEKKKLKKIAKKLPNGKIVYKNQ